MQLIHDGGTVQVATTRKEDGNFRRSQGRCTLWQDREKTFTDSVESRTATFTEDGVRCFTDDQLCRFSIFILGQGESKATRSQGGSEWGGEEFKVSQEVSDAIAVRRLRPDATEEGGRQATSEATGCRDCSSERGTKLTAGSSVR